MFIHAIPLMLAMLGGSSDGFSPGGEEQEFYRVLADYQAVRSLAELDLATIVKKDAADLALLHLIPDESSGASLKDGYLSQRSKGWVFPAQEIAKYRGRAGIITKGDWERVGSIAASANAKPKGMYDWLDKSSGRFLGLFRGRYYPLYDGGFVLAQHYPDKAGKEQFGTLVVLSEDTAKWVPAAYEFYQKNPDTFGKQLKEEQLVKLLGGENPMTAIMAAQRLAKSERLAGKALRAALDGPADFRRAVAVYLAFTSRDKDVAYNGHNEGDARVPPEIASAIKKADAKVLRLYAIAIAEAVEVRQVLTISARAALKLCRERAKTLHLDEKLREEFNDIFEDAQLPTLDPK